MPYSASDYDLETLESYDLEFLVYDGSSLTSNVDEAWLDMFARKQKSHEAILPTRATLFQHMKHAAYKT